MENKAIEIIVKVLNAHKDRFADLERRGFTTAEIAAKEINAAEAVINRVNPPVIPESPFEEAEFKPLAKKARKPRAAKKPPMSKRAATIIKNHAENAWGVFPYANGAHIVGERIQYCNGIIILDLNKSAVNMDKTPIASEPITFDTSKYLDVPRDGRMVYDVNVSALKAAVKEMKAARKASKTAPKSGVYVAVFSTPSGIMGVNPSLLLDVLDATGATSISIAGKLDPILIDGGKFGRGLTTPMRIDRKDFIPDICIDEFLTTVGVVSPRQAA